MATIAGEGKVKLNDGKVVSAQQGGWYDGQQYWGGTLSAPGVINSLSNQQGAGQRVSNDVIAQTNPNNVAYIQQQAAEYSRAGSVTPYLNSYQAGLFNSANTPETRVQSASEIAEELRNSGILPRDPAPTPPSLTEQYTKLTQEAGVDAIQTSIRDLKAKQDELAAGLRTNTAAEQGKPVATNIIQGRITEQERIAREDYDFVSRQLSRKTDELNSAMGNIQMIMQFTQTDYQNAAQSYATQFEQAISTFNLIRGIQQDQKNDIQRAQDNARANAQIMVNMITAGNLSVNDLPPDQMAQLNKLEVQAGLPAGFFGAIRMDPDANVLFTNTNDGITQVGIRNADGSVSVQSYGTRTGGGGSGGTGGKPGSSESLSLAISEMNSKITSKLNSYGDISPANWSAALNSWLSAGFKKDDFVRNFGQYADTNRGDFATAYGFKNPSPRE